MAKIRYSDGTVINFQGDPTAEDIESAYQNVKGYTPQPVRGFLTGAMQGAMGGAEAGIRAGSQTEIGKAGATPESHEGMGAMIGSGFGMAVPGPVPTSLKAAGGAYLGSVAGQSSANFLRAAYREPQQPINRLKATGRAIEAGTTYGIGKALFGAGPGSTRRFGKMLDNGKDHKMVGTIDASEELGGLREAYTTKADNELTKSLQKDILSQKLLRGSKSQVKEIIEGVKTSLTRREAQDMINTLSGSRDKALRAVGNSLRRKVYGSLEGADKFLYEGYGMGRKVKSVLGTAARWGAKTAVGAGAVAGAGGIWKTMTQGNR